MSDLIAAIATGSIATAIGIVRVSGDGCFALCDRVFRPRNGVPFAQQPSHKMVFGEMLDDSGAVIDSIRQPPHEILIRPIGTFSLLWRSRPTR